MLFVLNEMFYSCPFWTEAIAERHSLLMMFVVLLVEVIWIFNCKMYHASYSQRRYVAMVLHVRYCIIHLYILDIEKQLSNNPTRAVFDMRFHNA